MATRKSLLEKLDLHHPLHTGYLYKQAHVPPKNFNKRFFVLFPKVLVYYDNEKEFGRDVTSRTLAVSLTYTPPHPHIHTHTPHTPQYCNTHFYVHTHTAPSQSNSIRPFVSD